MIKVFRITNNAESPKYSLSIDPGINTAGFAFLSPSENKVEYWSMKAERPTSGTAFPQMYLSSVDAVNEIVSLFPKVDFSKLSITMEYTYPTGVFSPALFMTYGMLIDRVLTDLHVSRVFLIPPLIPKFFLQQRGNASKGDTSRFVKDKLKAIVGKKRINSHIADSLLFSVFLYYKWYMKNYKLEVREPSFEVVDVSRPDIEVYLKENESHGEESIVE
jgi:Holliday junction resolvasome RuvABC endonuclease subunit